MSKLKGLAKILGPLGALAVVVFAGLPEGVSHIIACVGSCYLVHLLPSGWDLLRGRDSGGNHHD